jgi:exopolysaccharide biosynthesis polyprenyl glycosylphosphotransferase
MASAPHGSTTGLDSPTPPNGNGHSIWKSRWLSWLLLGADAIGLSACWLGAWAVRDAMEGFRGPINDVAPYLRVYPLIVFVGLANCLAFGLYVHRRRISSLNRPSTILRAGYHWLLYIMVVAFFFKELDLGRSVILLAGLLGFVWLGGSRTVLRHLKARAVARGRGTVRTAIVGEGALAIEVMKALRTHPEIGFAFVGMIRHSPGEPDAAERALMESEGARPLGNTESIHEIVDRERIEEVFLAVAHLDPREQLDLLNIADRRGLSVHVVSNIFGVITEQAKVDEIGTFPVITLRDGYLPLHQTILKRLLDVFCGVLGCLVWLLFFHWWIALRIKFDSPGPVFFRQQRVGRDGQVFEIIKYRTMRTDAPAYAVAPVEEEDPRITRFGRWLRRTSLDELPQLLNVLRGEMSMVGPRPEMPFIVEGYQAWQRRRLDVKPGVTGLWQVIGRKNLPLHLNMEYDFYYIKNQSFLLDVEILFRTIPAVLKGRGAF